MAIDSSRLIFIGGCPRSGTTLIKRILDAHSKIFCGPEFGHLPSICNQYELMKKGVVSGRLRTYCSEEELKLYFQEFLFRFIEGVLCQNKALYFAEKTPDNLLVFFTLHELFPGAKFLHVIRNPLDVVASYLKVGARSSKDKTRFPHFYSARLAAMHWLKNVNSLWAHKDKFNAPLFQQHYFEVKHEDVVNNTEETISALCNWLGVDFEPGQAAIGSMSNSAGDPSNFGNVFYTREEYFRPIDSSSVGAYAERLSPEEIEDVLSVAGKMMGLRGYSVPKKAGEEAPGNSFTKQTPS